jgi:hypothetical protein
MPATVVTRFAGARSPFLRLSNCNIRNGGQRVHRFPDRPAPNAGVGSVKTKLSESAIWDSQRLKGAMNASSQVGTHFSSIIVGLSIEMNHRFDSSLKILLLGSSAVESLDCTHRKSKFDILFCQSGDRIRDHAEDRCCCSH